MKRSNNIICILGFVFLSAVFAGGNLRADEFETLEKLSLSIEKSLDSLQTNRSRLIKDGETVAAQLDMLRTQELLSPKEHRQMEKLLQKSQALNSQMENTNRAIASLKQRYDETVEMIVERCGAQLSEINGRLESSDTVQKSLLLARMQTLLKAKELWESKLSSPKSVVPQTINLALQPWNNRQEIRLKGDILMDEVEAIQQEIRSVEKRIKSLNEERQLRQNVSEMSRELSLFNERDELIGRHLAAADPGDSRNAVETFYGEKGVRNTGEAAGPAVEEIFLPNPPQGEKSSVAPYSSELRDQIAILEQYKKRLITRADSLGQRASWFYKKAESGPR
jgi:hypothetical protein